MNLEDLLKNISTSEDSQALASFAGVGDGRACRKFERQGSLTLPRTLSQKTVDELWRDFQKETERRVVREDAQPTGTSNNVGFTGVLGQLSTNDTPVNIAFQQPTQSPGLLSNQFVENNMLNVETIAIWLAKGQAPVVSMPSRSVNTTTVQGGVVQDDEVPGTGLRNGVTLTPAKGGSWKSTVEEVGDRAALWKKLWNPRHRRMIKNRESAARSRARKQAYTLELEAEVAKLKEINEELQNKQLSEKMNMSWGNKFRCLRRTLTGPWQTPPAVSNPAYNSRE
ncbi:hypothetical protein HAX54_037364 [Datura stramonium]|uniref:BZIP domain-containing protein n=1 Tax=Datura stramonium TaxID=4076 RepID=A0ABS8RN00_DATST|nr:hypothetical protein [Datura stramonium]